jgi:uncharacterized heparinase superfamily protein
MLGPSEFFFLNNQYQVLVRDDWNTPSLPKLWLYNLHYFDDLNAEGASDRAQWHRLLIRRWIAENPPGVGIGWEPYPLSLRIINWIKWAQAGNLLDETTRQSLAVQVRFLYKRLEHHLLGNHLFANAKALVFAGCYFEGVEAEVWLRLGMSIITNEIPEQILLDGGHFERSTMYHALAYEDMLDLLNLSNVYPSALLPWKNYVSAWPDLISRMGEWLCAMSHPDGEIAFFNDAAIGISPSPLALHVYAKRLGLTAVFVSKDITYLASSGYIRVVMGPAVLLIDVAVIGPDYLPGHAHADTLTYEFSLFDQRLIVNSGTSQYDLGPQRQWERSTAAHNTLQIDCQNSSEVWASFRVARRGYPFDISVMRNCDSVIVEAAHNGYFHLPGKVIHRRRWKLCTTRLEVLDIIEGDFTEAVTRAYFHPNIQITKSNKNGIASWKNHEIFWETNMVDSALEKTMWHPEFGLSIPNQCIRMLISPSNKNSESWFALDWR